MDDHVLVKGRVEVRKNGKVVYSGRNLVVNAGLGLIATLLSGSGTAPAYMAVGSGLTLALPSQTALVTETHRVAASHAVVSNSITYTSTFTGQNVGTETVAEFGILNASSSGTMLCRFTCPPFSWAAGDTMVVTWTIDIGELG